MRKGSKRANPNKNALFTMLTDGLAGSQPRRRQKRPNDKPAKAPRRRWSKRQRLAIYIGVVVVLEVGATSWAALSSGIYQMTAEGFAWVLPVAWFLAWALPTAVWLRVERRHRVR